MTASEKVAYLKGLAEGLDIDKKSKEGKLFAAIIDTLKSWPATSPTWRATPGIWARPSTR